MTELNSKYWLTLVQRATEQYSTPFFLFSQMPIVKQLDHITQVCGPSVSNWLSFKTLPIPHLLQWWKSTGVGIEVVSEFELLAAYKEGFSPEQVIVNGVAKHVWNQSCWANKLRVNFDSINEIESLSFTAKKKKWRIGIRFHPTNQMDPENTHIPDQFGIPQNRFHDACNLLKREGMSLDSIHIHLRSNIPQIEYYWNAIRELELSLKKENVQPNCLNLGGGLPVKEVSQIDPAWNSIFSVEDLSKVIRYCQKKFPTIHEYILENGRYILSRCGVLVLSINDIKEFGKYRFLICDGGRTNHALLSDWEVHDIDILPNRSGEVKKTIICGPTCMAFDRLAVKKLSKDIRIGDKVIWFNAGAYHLSWETRFSRPLARVLWHNERDELIEARTPESFKEWWGRWR